MQPNSSLRPPLLLGLLAATLFGGAFALGSAGKPLPDYLSGWRGWDDLAIASTYVRDHAFPVGPYVIGNLHRRQSPEFKAFRRPIMKTFKDRPVTDVLASLDVEELVARRAFPVTRVDDSGRAFYLAILYRFTGAVRPLVLLWLPVTLVSLALGWVAFELALRRRFVAALVMPLLVSLSSFIRNVSAEGYAAYGFYLAAGLGLLAFAIALGSSRAAVAWPRLLAASMLLAIAIPARSAALLFVPGFLVVWLWRSRGGGGREKVVAVGLGLLALAFVPSLGVRAIDHYSAWSLQERGREAPGTSGGHDIWPTLWIGLGDFDRTKGHQYLDEAAKKIAVAAGVEDRIDRSAEGFFRNVILTEIASDPGWYAEILARRIAATFFLTKLGPSATATGQSFAPSSHPNEGAFDAYMGLVPTVDRFGWGRFAIEVSPLWLWIAWVPVLGAGLVSGPKDDEPRADVRVLLVGLIGFMASPVIVTTASAIEMEAAATVHFLAWALALDGLGRRAWSYRAERGLRPSEVTE